ncbi:MULTISPECIES: sensor domain-containing phosphodiesterase [Paraburkholderia]|jgi:EAL domain-containing protein (putative c-di-GMP-specific phosphodiesterase class I)|uniref:EAL domain, c-di-GMP-specific phosphodiesterase class I (Or its enzymatically inactive variant) n=1 Tax=Paraburkholderia phenazinium TaxID=60549 RepID=A0A1N6KKJ3_9BURK|nr:EAL domain-containing protein [Paraburkholderia phenazinium]SIO57095.1 EAL domain, c-di-GMP-specific phosphodiesterase class I (or its enzymatically inactive variant) [Paraburkholderia phenazinium]
MPTVEELTLSGLLPHLVRDEAGWTATWRALTLHSVFQPVLSITHQRIVGYEALLRAFDPVGLPVTPDVLFSGTRSAGEARELDRIARCLHVANFMEQHVEVGWLFLNTRPQVFETGWPQRAFIDELSAHFGLPQERIVIEVLEQPADDESAVASMLAASQPRDFLIAIDDFGTGFSNFDRVWRFRPDIVKLDRSLVARAGKRQGDESLIGHLIAMLHQSGTLVLAEGVETDDELMILMQADVDFVQGFWLGQPKGSVQAACARVPALIDSMWRKFADYERKYARHKQLGFEGFAEAVLAAAGSFAANGDLAEAARLVFPIPEARRVFVTDAQGEQTLPSISAPAVPPPPQRLAPLLATTRSNWSRRAYFKHALAAPGRVAMMGPHYSLIDGQDCYTAAVTLEHGGKTTILCVDFIPGEPNPPATPGVRKR